jgi:hypothetical protein
VLQAADLPSSMPTFKLGVTSSTAQVSTVVSRASATPFWTVFPNTRFTAAGQIHASERRHTAASQIAGDGLGGTVTPGPENASDYGPGPSPSDQVAAPEGH